MSADERRTAGRRNSNLPNQNQPLAHFDVAGQHFDVWVVSSKVSASSLVESTANHMYEHARTQLRLRIRLQPPQTLMKIPVTPSTIFSCLGGLIAARSGQYSAALPDVMKKIQWLLAFLLTALAGFGPSFAREQPMEFTPQNGFDGESEGQGSLKLFLGKPRTFHVTSHGGKQSDGTFRLDQTINLQGDAPHERFWILTATGNNHYSATLSDAAGPVQGVTSGSHLSLRYRVKGPLVMHQELELSPDGRTIDNLAVITLLGVPVGHLHETIIRKAPAIQSGNSKPD